MARSASCSPRVGTALRRRRTPCVEAAPHLRFKRRQSHIFTHQNGVSVARTLRPKKVGRLNFLFLSAPWRFCARIWVEGDIAFAPESWVPSASRPFHFSIRRNLRDSRFSPKRQRTAVATKLPPPCPCAFVRAPFSHSRFCSRNGRESRFGFPLSASTTG